MLTLIKPKLKPGNHATMNRSQYTVTHGYVNGLGLPVAVVDRRGCSVIINPSSNMGFTGKLVITVFHSYVGGCQLNSLSHIQNSPELAKLWGDEHQGIKRDFVYSYELDYSQLANKGWCYVDEMDVIVTTNFLSPGDVVHPRHIMPVADVLSGQKRGRLMDIFLTGYPPGTVRYMQVGPTTITVKAIGEDDPNEKKLHIYSFGGEGIICDVLNGDFEIRKYVGKSVEEAHNLESVRLAARSIESEKLKALEDIRRRLEKSVGEATANINDALSNIERRLDYADRISKVELEEEALKRKTSADSLKYVSPISKLLMDVLG